MRLAGADMFKKRAFLLALTCALVGAFFLPIPISVSATDPISHDFDTPTQYPGWLTGTATVVNYTGWYLGTPSASGEALLVTGTNNTLGTNQGMAVGVEFILAHPVYVTTLTAWVYNSQSNFSTLELHEMDETGGITSSSYSTGAGTATRTMTLNRVISRRFVVRLHKSGFGGTTTIGFDDLQINADQAFSPTPTPTPSPTPGPSPTPNPGPTLVPVGLCTGWQEVNIPANDSDGATLAVSGGRLELRYAMGGWAKEQYSLLVADYRGYYNLLVGENDPPLRMGLILLRLIYQIEEADQTVVLPWQDGGELPTITINFSGTKVIRLAANDNIDEYDQNTGSLVYEWRICNTLTPTPPPPPPPGSWVKPFTFTDRIGEGGALQPFFSELDGGNAVLYETESEGVNVLAATSGTVISVVPLTSLCINEPVLILPKGEYCVSPFSISNYHYGGAWRVVIEPDDLPGYSLTYVVKNPVVLESTRVSAGCILGQALLVTSGQVPPRPDRGYTVMQLRDTNTTVVSLLFRLIAEPSPSICDRPGVSPECRLVGDPSFQLGNRWWEPLGNVEFMSDPITPGGVVLGTGNITQWLSLDQTRQYGILLRFAPRSIGSQTTFTFEVALGDQGHTITYIPSGTAASSVEQTIAPQAYTTSDPQGLFALRLSGIDNASSGIILHVCIFDPDEEIPGAAGGCVIFDPELDDSSKWTKSGGAIIEDGVAKMPAASAISQNLTLFSRPSDGVNYRLTVRFRRASGSSNATVDWEWFEEGAETLGPNNGYTWRDFSDVLSVPADESRQALLVLTAGDAPIHVDRVCITPVDGGIAPGYGQPASIAGCKLCTYLPIGDLVVDFSEFVNFFLCFISQIWECQAKLILMGLWNLASQTLQMLGYLRWWGDITITGAWEAGEGNITVFANYLNGHFHNLTSNLASAILYASDGGGGDNIFTVLAALVNGIAQIITSIIEGIFGLLRALLELIFALLMLLINLITGFMANFLAVVVGAIIGLANGINSAPEVFAPEWLPNCTAPNNPLDQICWGLALLEEGLSFGAAAYLVPIFIGISALSLVLWGAEKLLGAVQGENDA